MGPFQRILKNLGAMLTGRVVSLVQQVIVPPIFLWRYGTAGFGEWSALYGTVSALSLLNFGVQTYMNQDLAVRYQRGETEGYKLRQSTALRLLLGMVTVVAALLLVIFLLPVDNILRLHISRAAAQWTIYLLSLYVLLSILFGYFSGIFMGVALAHRGANWNNFQQFISALGLLAGVTLHLPFPLLATGLLCTLTASMLIVLIDLRRTAPELAPTLRGWDSSAVKDILRGSGYFGLIETSTFLVYSLPLLLLQRLVGPVAVAGFVLMRTIFSMARQVLSMFTQSMGAEITNLFGRQDWPALRRLYDYSERMIFFLIAQVNLLVLLLSPVLITLWVHKKGAHSSVSQLFSVTPYVLASATSIVVSLKEHKHQFQFSTNTHEELARVVFSSYVGMVLVSIGMIHVAGVDGFLWTWLAVESFQVVRLVSLNQKLFAHMEAIDTAYITRLASVSLAGLLVSWWALQKTSALPLWEQAALAVGASAILGVIAWNLFHVRPVAAEVFGRVRSRFAKGAI